MKMCLLFVAIFMVAAQKGPHMDPGSVQKPTARKSVPTPLISRPTDRVPQNQKQCAIRHCGALRRCMHVQQVTNHTFVFSFACKKEPYTWICCPRLENCQLKCPNGTCFQFHNVTLESHNNFVDIQVHDIHLVGNHALGKAACASANGVCGRSNICNLRVGLAKYRIANTLSNDGEISSLSPTHALLNDTNVSSLSPTPTLENEADNYEDDIQILPRHEIPIQNSRQPTSVANKNALSKCPPCHRLHCIAQDCSCILLCRCPAQCKNGICSRNTNLCKQCSSTQHCPIGNFCDDVTLPGL